MADQPLATYQRIKEGHEIKLSQINKKHRILGAVRLLVALSFLFALYLYFGREHQTAIYMAPPLFVLFFFLIKIHQRLARTKAVLNALIEINSNEIDYLETGFLAFDDGSEFNDAKHPYTSDLDVFGPHSLFQHLNRTGTFIGKQKLAMLLSGSPTNDRAANQEAIKELNGELDWRQQILALTKTSNDSQDIYQKLKAWSQSEGNPSRVANIISYISPIVLLLLIALYFLQANTGFLSNAIILFVLFHLTIANIFAKRFQKNTINIHKIDEIINDYSLILQLIHNKEFKSSKLKDIKDKINNREQMANAELRRLSHLFARVDNVQNIFGNVILNGVFLYHLHTLKKIDDWKKENAESLQLWIDIIGEIEALSSIANFSFNNPDFTFPTLNDNYVIEFEDLGHPLIPAVKRKCNSLDFNTNGFIILTGSNMSGKSTFLRTLGVNMLLAGIGAPICASRASIHPLPIFVSMGQSDSLVDNKSYFFAEVKRLKFIMDQLSSTRSFVLLDEILRGTNSDDKRNGTIQVIEQLLELKALGVIATHDLEVCNIAQAYPRQLANKCFEVEIVNNELMFDYQLREGVCKNKSATFLMQKMGVVKTQ